MSAEGSWGADAVAIGQRQSAEAETEPARGGTTARALLPRVFLGMTGIGVVTAVLVALIGGGSSAPRASSDAGADLGQPRASRPAAHSREGGWHKPRRAEPKPRAVKRDQHRLEKGQGVADGAHHPAEPPPEPASQSPPEASPEPIPEAPIAPAPPPPPPTAPAVEFGM